MEDKSLEKFLLKLKPVTKKATREGIDEVLQIFQPFGDWSTHILFVETMIRFGLVTYSTESIPFDINTPISVETLRYVSGRETSDHLTLKSIAEKLLEKLGEDHVLFEYNLWDVYSPKLRIRVECGCTDPHRLVESFMMESEKISEFWVLQYSNKLYKFKPSKDCKEILDTFYGEIMNELGERLRPKEVRNHIE